MKRLLFMIAVGLAVTAVSSQAQSLNAGQIQFTLDGQAVGTLLLPTVANGSNAGGYEWKLPDQSGELSLGGGNPWEVGGNSLASPGSLGTQTPQDVNLITNNTTRMTLLGGTAAVLLPTQTELRLGDAAGSEYSALKSPTAITGGSNDGTITYILPDALPGGVDVRLKVKDVDYTTGIVELEYTNPSTTGQIGFRPSGAVTTTIGNGVNDYIDVEGMNFTVNDGSIYSFEIVISLVAVAGNNQDVRLQFAQPFGTGNNGSPVGNYVPNAVVSYYVMNLDQANPVTAGGQVADVDLLLRAADAGDPQRTYILKGYIETGVGGVTPDNSTVQLVVRADDANDVQVTSKSSVQLITE